jgi:hypothetical protein
MIESNESVPETEHPLNEIDEHGNLFSDKKVVAIPQPPHQSFDRALIPTQAELSSIVRLMAEPTLAEMTAPDALGNSFKDRLRLAAERPAPELRFGGQVVDVGTHPFLKLFESGSGTAMEPYILFFRPGLDLHRVVEDAQAAAVALEAQTKKTETVYFFFNELVLGVDKNFRLSSGTPRELLSPADSIRFDAYQEYLQAEHNQQELPHPTDEMMITFHGRGLTTQIQGGLGNELNPFLPSMNANFVKMYRDCKEMARLLSKEVKHDEKIFFIHNRLPLTVDRHGQLSSVVPEENLSDAERIQLQGYREVLENAKKNGEFSRIKELKDYIAWLVGLKQ